ncbi:DUF7287 family protein [Halovivax cerinus]|uniref:Pilin/flagellin n=1 Tax=Halovivax cerinus TaxID=1487865 RepID=A0ABD5NKQ9_9EURY|nr:hypothetical protein [Halovivax cerinus]
MKPTIEHDRPTDATTDRYRRRDRAQTVQDFAVGIGIFLLAVAFVFTFVPTIITPFEDAGGADAAQADRIAATIVEDASTSGPTNELDWSEFDGGTYDEDSSEDLADELGLRVTDSGNAITRVNITLVEIETVAHSNPTVRAGGGDDYDDQVGASATRIVTTDSISNCDPACQLVVRVW